MGAGRGEGMAPQARERAVLLAEGTLQEQLREREGRQTVAPGAEAHDVSDPERLGFSGRGGGVSYSPPPHAYPAPLMFVPEIP